MKFIKISVLTTPATRNMERRVSVFKLLNKTKLQNNLAPNSLDKLMQLINAIMQ